MKLEKLYQELQERYPVEQEKKAEAEKALKQDLKKEILTIIHYAALYLDDYNEEVYKAYEKAREEQKGQEEERVYILFEICEDYVDCTMHVNDRSASIARKFKSNIRGHCEQINNLLRKLYCYASDKSCANSVDEERVHFDYVMKFNLTESTISLIFSAKPSTCGGFKEEEQTIIKKFISDIKEMFPNSEEIHELRNLTVTLNCFEIEIKDLGKSEQNSESSSDDVEEKDLVDELKLLSMPIDSLELCTRAIIALRRNGIYTIENLVQLSESKLLDFSHIGPRAVAEIKQKLQENGLALKES